MVHLPIQPRRPGLVASTGLLVVLSALIAGCAGTSVDDSGSSDSVVPEISVGLTADPASLDPAHATTQTDAIVAWALYDTLVKVDTDGNIIPHLAADWEQDADSVTFTLRDDVTCEDGTVLTADDAAASLNRLVAPETESHVPGLLWPGLNMTATSDAAAGTVTVAMSQAWGDLLVDLSYPATAVICPSGLAPDASLEEESHGTGAYTVAEVRRGERYVLTLRDGYDWAPATWEGADGRRPATVNLDVVENEATTVNLLQTGDLDAAVLLGPDVERLRGQDGLTLVQQAVGSAFVQFNEAPGRPLADEAVRRGVVQAIDRERFAEVAFGDRAELLGSIAPPFARCVAEDAAASLPSFDPEASRAALDGQGLDLHVLGTTQVGGGAGTEYIQAALEHVGVATQLTNTDTTTWSTELFSGGGDWDVTVMAVGALTPSVRPAASHFAGPPPPDGTNIPSMDSPAFQEAFGTATQSVGEQSCDAWREAQRRLVSGAHTVPLTTIPAVTVFRDGIDGQTVSGIIELGSITG